MARFLTIAHKIAERIESQVPELAGRAIVYRRDDADAQLEKRLRMSSGRCVIVRLLGTRNPAKSTRRTLVEYGLYTVTLFTDPLLTAKDTKAADDLMDEIKSALQGWWPDGVSSNKTWSMDCQGCDYADGFKTANDQREVDAIKLTLHAPGNLS